MYETSSFEIGLGDTTKPVHDNLEDQCQIVGEIVMHVYCGIMGED